MTNRVGGIALGGLLLLLGGVFLGQELLRSPDLRFASPVAVESGESEPMPCPRPVGSPSSARPSQWTTMPLIPGRATDVAWTLTASGEIVTVQGDADGSFAAVLGEGSLAWTCHRLSANALGEQPVLVRGGDAVYLWTDNVEQEVLALKLEAGVWRTLPSFPLDRRTPAVLTWIDEGLLVWGGVGETRAQAFDDGAVYVPADGEWRQLAPAPRRFTMSTATWSGTELWIVGALLDTDNRSATASPEMLRYRPSDDRWQLMPPPPISPQAFASAWSPSGLVLWDYLLKTVRFQIDGLQWRQLPDLPFDPLECYPDRAEGSDRIYALYCGRIAVLESEATWRELSSPAEIMQGAVDRRGRLLVMGASSLGARQHLWRHED